MELNFSLDLNTKKELEKKKRVRAAEKKVKEKYIPVWDELWITGYTSHTGVFKRGIYQSKLTDSDKEKLIQVKEAVESGEIGMGVKCLSKFSKSYALSLYQGLKEQRREGIIADMVKNKPSNYILIDNVIALYSMLQFLNEETVIGLDTETTGLSYDDDFIVGISLTLPITDKHYYIPVRHNLIEGEKQLEPTTVFTELKPYLENEKLGKVLHNCKFDWHMFYREGIEINNVVMDTMVAFHILSENETSYALKNIATKWGKYFGFEDKSSTYEELFGKGGFENTRLDIGTIYACKDTHLCYQLYVWIDQQLKEREGLHYIYYNIENPILRVAIEMEKNGFLIDTKYASSYVEELKEQIGGMEEELHKYFGDINVGSNQQLSKWIYEDVGQGQIKTSNGKKGVDKATLKYIVVNYEKQFPELTGLKLLLEYRGLSKLLSTYIEPLPQKVWKRDGRLHGSFNQTATATGRWASNNPNLQNLPYSARKIVVAPEGKIIIGSDYSQIEPRLLAHMSGDNELMRPYVEGTDLYSTLAANVFKVDISECGDGSKYRKMMKTGLLAVMYGTSTHTLSGQLGISMEEAEQFILDFYNTYPQVQDFIKATQDKADDLGYVETLYGRKRRFVGHTTIAKKYKRINETIIKQLGREPKNIWQEKELSRDLKQAYWEVAKEYGRVNRQSVNAVIQGSAADLMKLGMLAVQEYLVEKGSEWKLLATIHDEILVELPDTATLEEIQEVANRMTQCVSLSIPLKSDVEVMTRWGEGIPLKEYIKNRAV